jgi:hypothetical protein
VSVAALQHVDRVLPVGALDRAGPLADATDRIRLGLQGLGDERGLRITLFGGLHDLILTV